ncbi:hypothetical protein SAMN02745885_00459 [Carboxydocella sporoproducens DSM 16521]|uniref:Uncharacterized protein n=2 Tax=Carboxydocella TaxID=178898 RepID=A0A1T4M6V7_9FIRM|nr:MULTISPECIES: hypothetical protein [Carboxydocella]AVX21017.1 hypothetical protein CFE_1846 [Carboxydocella thermautotrophica]SJZ62750.1 hypothetical protein SAMN02745885_00459 [Carboxydocella sporoproducens DSM 16521]
MSDPFIEYSESMVATVAKLFALEGSAKEVAILAHAVLEVVQTNFDNWNGGTYFYTLYLYLPLNLYVQIVEEKEKIQKRIYEKLFSVGVPYNNHCFEEVLIYPQASNDPNWRDKAKAWLSGKNITNQGRVRSDNIASRNCDGLLFRSQPEINFILL